MTTKSKEVFIKNEELNSKMIKMSVRKSIQRVHTIILGNVFNRLKEEILRWNEIIWKEKLE